MEVVMKLMEQYDGIMFWQTYALGRSIRKPRIEHWEDPNGTIIYIRAGTRTQSWSQNLSNFVFLPLNWKGHGQLFQL